MLYCILTINNITLIATITIYTSTVGNTSNDAPFKWSIGRAPVEMIEISQALDVLVSGIRLEGDVMDSLALTQVCYCYDRMYLHYLQYSTNNYNHIIVIS